MTATKVFTGLSIEGNERQYILGLKVLKVMPKKCTALLVDLFTAKFDRLTESWTSTGEYAHMGNCTVLLLDGFEDGKEYGSAKVCDGT